MPKDYTKYEFNGEILAKNRLVLAVIKAYVEQHQPTLEQLTEIFPNALQGSMGLFCTEDEFNERFKKSEDARNRFFTKEDERITLGEERILVSTQWGKGNIFEFIKHAQALGFDIKGVAESSSDMTRIWKVSHSPSALDSEHISWLADHQLLAVHESTGNGSVGCFDSMSKGDIVSLGYGGQVAKLVRVTSDVMTQPESPLGGEWLMRSYEVVQSLDKPVQYKGKHKRWSPRFNGTCWEVPSHEYWMFEEEILAPYFDLSLEGLGFTTDQIGPRPQKETVAMSTQESAPLNQILYGPPGTGKTYHTIAESVRLAEPEFYAAVLGDLESINAEQRTKLKSKYAELKEAGRIRFVTFHQSFGYEEFVEGLRASTNEAGDISYSVEPGVFRQICEAASHTPTASDAALEESLSAFQLQLAEQEQVTLTTQQGKSFTVEYHGNKTFRVFPDQTKHDDLGRGYAVSIDNIRKLYRQENTKNIYNISYTKAILSHLQQSFDVPEYELASAAQPLPYVLIIDEINRGNISKIFGELITLIEDSKRQGADDELSVQLPYSGEAFSVPANLYIIGTMNTADRSLALMDTALRRRFKFKEMMPEYTVLIDQWAGPVELATLLETMNQRIELLYDREHMLGHALLMSVLNAPEVQREQALFSAFENSILPLLQEYFFDDWHKIRLVLGDVGYNKPTELQFVTATDSRKRAQQLFGKAADELNLIGNSNQFALNLAAFRNIESYAWITGSPAKTGQPEPTTVE